MLGNANRKNRNVKGVKINLAAPGTTNVNGDATVTRQPRDRHSGASDISSLNSESTGSSSSPSLPTSASDRRSSSSSKLTDQLAGLELGLEFSIDVRPEDLKVITELGAGAGGTVSKVKHVPTGATMARKIVHIEAKPSVRKQILREVQIMHECNSPYIVSFYGAAIEGTQIWMCLEYMDKGSLDSIYKKHGAIEIDILGKITYAVVAGLTYLYSSHRIIHRDVKPSNILVNSHGQVKLCDFGVSGELINSVADTFVGTSTYMSPERIQGAAYTVRSDVWSLGITLIELALGRFPFADDDDEPEDGEPEESERTLSPVKDRSSNRDSLAAIPARRRKSPRPSQVMSIIDQLQHIVNEDAPTLPAGRFSPDACDFVAQTLLKDVDKRPTPKQLLAHAWLVEASTADVNLEQWASLL